MSWTHSRDKNEHASLATSATTDNPATDELSGDFLCSSLLSGGNSGASSSDDSSLMDGEGETSNRIYQKSTHHPSLAKTHPARPQLEQARQGRQPHLTRQKHVQSAQCTPCCGLKCHCHNLCIQAMRQFSTCVCK